MSGRPAVEFGPYLVYERLGAGGMATVHRAELHGIAGFRRQVALKRLLPSVAAQPEFVQAFIEEARLASKLQHNNIALTFDLGKVGDDYFIAMEYIAGPTLMQVIRQCISAAGAMPMSIALHVLTEIAEALNHAHNLCDDHGRPLGLIHRDVSPSNIMISNSGVAKLIDFGIAKAASSEMRTMTGIIKGKFGYIAPEYIAGEIDERADLFGFGVIAHELMTTRMLFHVDDDFETLRRVREMKIEPPSKWNRQIPHDLDDIVMTALERDPNRRWQSAQALRTALVQLARSRAEPVSSHHVAHWVEWAFQQLPGKHVSGLTNIIDSLADPSGLVRFREHDDGEDEHHEISVLPQIEDVPSGSTTGLADPVKVVAATRGSRASRGSRGSGLRLALLVILLVVVGGAAAAWHYGLVPRPF